MSPATPEYHRDATALLPTVPRFSGTAAEGLDRREHELGIRFPDAVREWYSFEGAVDLLRQHGNADTPLPVDKLGEPFPNWYGGGPRDFVAQGLVVFMHENQGVCNWAFKLDGNPDPEVLVEVDISRSRSFESSAGSHAPPATGDWRRNPGEPRELRSSVAVATWQT